MSAPPEPRRARGRLRFAAVVSIALILPAALLIAAEPVNLKTFDLGNGPTLVFVPDICLGRGVWMPVARKLLATHRVVLVDLPGHGESPMLDPFSLEATAEALDRVLTRERADSLVLVGHGVGGLIALVEGRAHPDHLRGVVVVDAGIQVAEGIADQQKKQFMDMLDERYDEFLRVIFTKLARDSTQGIAMHAQATLVSKPVVMAYLRQLVYADQAAMTKGFKLPLLAVVPDREWPAEKDWATVSKELGFNTLPDVTPRRIGASAHFVMVDHPDSLATAIAEFSDKMIAKKK
jgi:pimeloyl-ACP methyl ester carboxylesterase